MNHIIQDGPTMETEPVYVGRVMSLTMLSFAGFGLLGLPIGYLADRVGERLVLSGMGAAVCVIVIFLGVALRRAMAAAAMHPVPTSPD